MVDPVASTGRIETREDLGPEKDEASIYAYWMGQEAIAEREERKWIKKGREIVKRYRDDRPENTPTLDRMNIFWSNVQTLLPTLYARTPKPDVRRTFDDDDPIGLFAAELMQRCLEYSCDAHDKHFDVVMEAVTEDRLLAGRACARVLYVPHFGDPITTPDGQDRESSDDYEAEDSDASTITNAGDEGEGGPDREVVYEEVIVKYLFWEDYREGPARQYDEVPWQRYRAYLTRDELVARFGAKGKKVQLDYEPKGTPDSVKENIPPDMYKKACVHEIWDKTKLRVIWIAPGTPDLVLDQMDDPLHLPGFYPIARPLLANKTNDKRIPVPDYIQYQDQARQLDKITGRIDKLTSAMQVKGFYPGDEKQALQQLIDEGTENRLIPVHDWQALVDKGGIKDIIQWMPIEQIAGCLIQLYDARERTKQILYELTGMSDILRGQTSPIETKGAQDLKARFATRRISPKQKQVADYACGLIKLMGSIIAEHFSAKTISMITGFPQSEMVPVPQLPPPPPQMVPAPSGAAQPGAPMAPAGGPPSMAAGAPVGQSLIQMQPNPAYQQWQQMAQAVQAAQQKNQAAQQKFDQACQLIKKDGVHGFRIDIEADSTIAPDEEAEKEDRTSFMQQFIPFLGQVVPMAMGNPAAAELGEAMTLFVMRPFKVARTLEDAVTKFFEQLKGMPPMQPGGKEQANGPDSPQALAQRQADTQSRERIANQTNMVKLADIAARERGNMAKLAEDASQHHDQLAHEMDKEADMRAYRNIKGEQIMANEAKNNLQ